MRLKDVGFKDSRIDWIGAVPIDWNVTRLKSVCSTAESGKRPPEDEEQVLSIGGEHIQDGEFCLENARYVSYDTYVASRGKINLGDLLVVKDGATIGKCMYPEIRLAVTMPSWVRHGGRGDRRQLVGTDRPNFSAISRCPLFISV